MHDDKVTPIRLPEVIAEVGGVIDQTSVTLAIHGDDLDPDEVSALLGCAPTHAHRRGDSRPHSPPCTQGAWLLSVEGQAPTEPETLLNKLFAKLPDDSAVWDGIGRRFTVRLYFGLFLNAWNRGFDLSPFALRRVAGVGATLGFDIYAEEGECDG